MDLGCYSGPRHQNSLFIRSARCVTQKIIGDRLHLTARRARIFLIRLTELLRTHRSQHALRTLAVTSRLIVIHWGISATQPHKLLNPDYVRYHERFGARTYLIGLG